MSNLKYDSNNVHYVAVTGMILKDGDYLIVKRSTNEKAFPGLWTVPGGKLEVTDYTNRLKDTESHWYNVLEGCLRREVMEEVRLKIKNIRYLTSMSYIRSDGIPTVIVSLYADYDSGKVDLCSALTEYRWVTLGEARLYNLVSGLLEEFEMLDMLLSKGHVVEWHK